MNMKAVFGLLVVSLLLFGAVSAQKNMSEFKVNDTYKNANEGPNHVLYINDKQDSGITIYRDVTDNDVNDAYDDLIHDEGRDYLTPDDDFKVDKNSDNTANFTDYDHAQHGVAELIDINGEKFVVVVWAKDSTSTSTADLITQLSNFNKDNNVTPVAY